MYLYNKYIMNKKEIIKEILEINNYDSLNPPQELASKYLTLSENIIVCSPTASGKTTIFEMYLLDYIINKKKKVLYISPLKALTNEHYKETKRKFEKKYNLKIGISTGDLDSSSRNLKDYDILFLTYEKFDSVIRHNPSWIKELGLITIDEIHELGSNRGATLEILITQIRTQHTNICFLALSATIGNSQEISNWLNAKLISSNYRPVPLEVCILNNKKLYFEDNIIELQDNNITNKIKDNGLSNIIYNTLKENKQIIIFCNSRKNTMSFSSKYSIITKEFNNSENLIKIAKKITQTLEQPTKQCLLLYNCIKNSIAFHHAGLVSKQRDLVEEEFKKGNIKVIFATPTLAAGINLPAYRVVINSIFRFNNGSMQPIPINEFHQMTGRAGRPKYDTTGQAIANITKEKDIPLIYNSYIIAKPTNIESQLSKIILLRSHLLSIILINNLETIDEILDYMSKTFYYFTFGNNIEIQESIKDIISEFIEYNFIKEFTNKTNKENKLKISELGKKVCLLYLDPISANNIINDLNIKSKLNLNKLNDTEKIFTICNTSELHPYINYKKENEDEIFSIFEIIKEKINFDYEDLNLLNKIQLCRLLTDWIEEIPEDKLIERYNSSPGHIQNIINKSNWIIHCTIELSSFCDIDKKIIKYYKELSIRLKYGIKEELIKLVELKNIGRVRARKLFNNNIKTINDIKKDPNKFIDIIGKIGLDTLKELKIEYQSNNKNKEKKIEKEVKNQNTFKIQKSIFEF
jgi:helicase